MTAFTVADNPEAQRYELSLEGQPSARPVCPFVVAYIARHRQFRDLLPGPD